MQRRTLALALAGAAALGAGTQARAQSGSWTALFSGEDLAGFDRIGNANWRVEMGEIVADRGNGMLVTRQAFGDFTLRVEFWVDAATNSGIYIRATDPANVTAANAYEVNIWDERPDPKYGTGAIVDVAAVDPMPRAGGRWNLYEITAKGDSFTVALNGQVTVNGARNGKHASGRIALQHGDGVKDSNGVANDRGVVRFRKVEIRPA
ncbi:3-keto-disaccharide hydrolase [Dankookia sp. P2]|uniref:3-keto-disaccharide hydrolase n=1 Tax=Dankookia sp. P2 TaxID=3423955 RepID=UPI003D679A15